MITFIRGNLFESKAQTLVNTVNCVGVMGKGVALSFKKKFPEMYKDYRKLCHDGKMNPGKLTLYKETTPWVLNFPTKRHWRANSKIEDIELGLIKLAKRYQEWGIKSLAMPALGCGYGGLNWEDVRPLIEKYLSDLEIDIEVYEPGSQAIWIENEPESKSETDSGLITDLFGNLVPDPTKTSKNKKRGRKKK